jgi:3-deoxy-D-manno-octulosonate 8-phosphate phosphatase (KDO 8-P phosphatase)
MPVKAPRIRLFAMDVDGTLTDGTITLSAEGGDTKTFHAHDGAGIKLLPGLGITPAIISGRHSETTARRARELGIEHVEQAVGDKAARLTDLCDRLGLRTEQAAFVGDDLSDVPAMCLAGWSAAPADAAETARTVATFVSQAPGGRGAVREAIEALLQTEGLWQDLLDSLGARRTEAPA